jgi:hypothetical protein
LQQLRVDWRTSGAAALHVDRESGELTVDALLLSRVAMVLGALGLLGAVRILPTVLLAVIIGAFVLAGPGSLLLSWYTHLPAYAVLALLPIVGLSFCILIVTLALLLGIYHPVWVLLGLTSATAVGGFVRTRSLARVESAAI